MKRYMTCVLLALLSSACADQKQGATTNSFDDERIECVEPARLKIEPWGKAGSLKGCEIADGPFVAADDGYIRMRGQFKNGHKAGVWRWYDRSGNVTKEVNYAQ